MIDETIELEMMSALEVMDQRLTTIRAGRANPALVNGLMVEYYGTPTPVQSLANITVPEAKTLMIKPFDKGCLKDIVKAMNINLEKEDAKLIKSFSYSINETYEPIIAGKGFTKGITNSTLPSFISKDKETAKEYCDENNIECNFTYIDENSQYYKEDIAEDLITYQSINAGTLVRNISSIEFYIKGASALLD